MNDLSKTMVRQRGLSLLEVLVALAIMALSLTVLYRVAGGSARAVFGSDARVRAIMQAESLLALRDVVPKAGWSEQGEANGLRWTIQSNQLLAGSASGQFPAMHRVVVEVRWQGALREERFELVGILPELRSGAGSEK